MRPETEFPNERLRWLDDLLAEIEKFAVSYELDELQGDLATARRTLLVEAERVNATPNHPVNQVRGFRDN